MMYSLGDRVRVSLTAEDGLPLVRYGFVRSVADAAGPVVVMFDGEIGGDLPVSRLRHDDPGLRRGLAPLWQAEAEDAGLDVDGMIHLNGDGADGPGAWNLAHFTSGGERYVLRALAVRRNGGLIRVHAVAFTDH